MIFESHFCDFLVTVYEDFQRNGDNKTILDSGCYGSDFFGITIKHCFQNNALLMDDYIYNKVIMKLNHYYKTYVDEYMNKIIDKQQVNTEIYSHSQNFRNCKKSEKKKYLKILCNYQAECHKNFNYLKKLSGDYLVYAKKKNKMFLEMIYEISCIDFLSEKEYSYLCDMYYFHTNFETYYYEWMSMQCLVFNDKCENQVKEIKEKELDLFA
jgi:hypothetical protein